MFAYFLSHLSGDEEVTGRGNPKQGFLSHLSGDEADTDDGGGLPTFLSHLSGDEDVLLIFIGF